MRRPSAARDALPCHCLVPLRHAPAFRRCSEPWQCSPEPPPCYPEPWPCTLCSAPAWLPAPRFAFAVPRGAMPSPADGVLCPCLPMPCTALAMRAFAVPCRRFAMLASAPCHAVVAAQSRRIESLCRCHARPCHRRADSAMLMLGNAAPRSAAAYLCFAAALLCVRCSAAANQRLAFQRHSCATQYSAVAMPIFALAVLSQTMPSQCSAPLCHSRPYPCFPLLLLACPLLCPRASERRSPMPPPCQTFPRLRLAPFRSAPADRCPDLPCLRFTLLCLGFALPLRRFAVLSHSFAAQSYALAALA